RANQDMAFAGLFEKMSAFSHDVLEELRSRFESASETMSNGFLLDLMKALADRSGNGPKSTQVNVNVDLSGRLEAARRRVEADGAPVEVDDSGVDGEALLLPPPGRAA